MKKAAALLIVIIFGIASLYIYQRVFINEEWFCKTLMSSEENKTFLQTVYDGDGISHEDLYLMFGTKKQAYLDYKKCIESSGYNKCWNDLINRDITTRRDKGEQQLAVATILYECVTRKDGD